MNYIEFQYIKYFIFASVIIYFVFDYFDQKKIKDEREEFLKLKTFELVQKVTLSCVTLLAVAYFLYPEMPAFVPIIVIVISCMYAEVFGKIWLRRKY
ncbi:MAG: hypothetical protein ABL930_12220 [Pseudobdellovibrio sp.]